MIYAIYATLLLVAVATAVACAWVDGWNRGYDRALNALRLEVPASIADDVSRRVEAAFTALAQAAPAPASGGVEPVPMELVCPACEFPHHDEAEWATRPHKTHLCCNCGHEWRPFPYPTVGVAALSLPNGLGEPVAWRLRQLHHEIDGPITDWWLTATEPKPSGKHRYEIQPLYALSASKGGGDE